MKSRSLKIASALLVLCLMSTCAIGATFAKYTTGSNATDTARVAEWGVEASIGGTLFGTAYGANGAAKNADSIMAETSTSVNTLNTDKIVAPGTKNDIGLLIKVKGQPEVAYASESASVEAENTDIYLKAGKYGVMVPAHGVNAATDYTAENIYYLDNGTYKLLTLSVYENNPTADFFKMMDQCDTADYYPVKWNVAKSVNDATAVDTAYTQTNEMATAIKNELAAISGDAKESINVSYKITWAWDFNTNDAADTILGNIAAGAIVVFEDTEGYKAVVETTHYNLTVGFNISVSVTQVD